MNQRQTDILKDLDDLRRRSRFSPEAWIATAESGESVELTPADESRILDDLYTDELLEAIDYAAADPRRVEVIPELLRHLREQWEHLPDGNEISENGEIVNFDDNAPGARIAAKADELAKIYFLVTGQQSPNAPEFGPFGWKIDGLNVPQEPERILEPSQDREKAKGKRGRPKGSTAPAEELIHRLRGNAQILAIWRERTKNLKGSPTRLARETLAAIIASGGEITSKTKGESLRKAVSQELKTDVSRRPWDKTTERYILAFDGTPDQKKDPTNVKERDEINQLSNYYK